MPRSIYREARREQHVGFHSQDNSNLLIGEKDTGETNVKKPDCNYNIM